MPDNETELALTVVITVVSGRESVRRNLTALYPQVDFVDSEIIVPFDKWSYDVGSLAAEFPKVRFHFINNLGLAASANISAHQHRLYDRRRAVGLHLARGRIVAMTEDHAQPAEDWCRQILLAHQQPYAVIGGAIENSIELPLNWALYYCDFGRYGLPFASGEVDYVSDTNVSYKRPALMAVCDVWREIYHETTVHRAMNESGIKLFLDKRIIVRQLRPPLSLNAAMRERIAWGRIFAETRVETFSPRRRFMFVAGTIFLPALLLARVTGNMRRQRRTWREMGRVLPLALLLLLAWSLGELIGYVSGVPRAQADAPEVTARRDICC